MKRQRLQRAGSSGDPEIRIGDGRSAILYLINPNIRAVVPLGCVSRVWQPSRNFTHALAVAQ